MKKKIYALLALALLCQSALIAYSSISIRSAGFYHACERFRDIYGDASVAFAVEASTSMDYSDLWVNLDWASDHGRSIGCDDPTRVKIANISMGAKIPFDLSDRITLSLGMGPSLALIDLDNTSCEGTDDLEKLVLGFVFKSCLSYFFTDYTAVELFVDYLYQPVSFETRVDIGGVKAGVGLAAYF